MPPECPTAFPHGWVTERGHTSPGTLCMLRDILGNLCGKFVCFRSESPVILRLPASLGFFHKRSCEKLFIAISLSIDLESQ